MCVCGDDDVRCTHVDLSVVVTVSCVCMCSVLVHSSTPHSSSSLSVVSIIIVQHRCCVLYAVCVCVCVCVCACVYVCVCMHSLCLSTCAHDRGFAAMTGNGSGVETPSTFLEHVFTLLILIMGVSIYATLLGNLSGIIQQMNEKQEEFRSKMSDISALMTTYQLPHDVQERVRACFVYLYGEGIVDDEDNTHIHTIHDESDVTDTSTEKEGEYKQRVDGDDDDDDDGASSSSRSRGEAWDGMLDSTTICDIRARAQSTS